MADHEIKVGKRFFRAAKWAADRHAARTPGAGVPSVAQVLGVSSFVLDDGGTEHEVIAAMLHDTVRTCGGVDPDELRERFGKKLSTLVERCTIDERGDLLVGTLDAEPDLSVLRVHAAEALRDTQTLVREMRRHGDVAFVRFDVSPVEQMAFLHSLTDMFRRRLPRSTVVQELRAAIKTLDTDRDVETATAAWRLAHAA